ncbi:MAG TPA: CPBP family intramembrane glutamic endopeptidase [Candidatus Acidoferrum sp.]|jgi:membrane protease YdiL (CAAX protease family)|nr:CPBP family intramembrane glutamic endopeptidase [Candidatus Acidoferrum sp.]
MIGRHPVVAVLVFLSLAAVCAEAFWSGELVRRVTYMVAMGCGIVITDVYTRRNTDLPADVIPVRRPGLELSFAAFCYLAAAALLENHFVWHFGVPGVGVALNFSLLFFVSSVPILLFDVAVLKYRFGDLGFRVQGLGLAVPILLCFAALATPTHTWTQVSQLLETDFGGSVASFISAGLFAAFSEEFLRFTWQTRLAEALGNSAAAWFIAAVMWSLLHYPMYGSLYGCLGILPEGLLWGYVMFRTRSLLPTMILHGLNFLWAFKAIR